MQTFLIFTNRILDQGEREGIDPPLPAGEMCIRDRLATVILPEKPSEEPQPRKLVFIKPVDVLSDAQMGNSAITINGIQQELDRMAGMVRQNVDASFRAVLEGRPTRLPAVEETEEYIDYLKMCIRDSAQPAWRANRETVAAESPRRWASCPMEENKKASVLVLI